MAYWEQRTLHTADGRQWAERGVQPQGERWWVRLCKIGVRKPHVGATRGGVGRSCASGSGEEENPAALKAENLDPKVPVPLREVGETPASGRLSRPPFPFLPVPWGAGIARGAWGETRQVRSPPSQRQRLRPSSPQLRAGLPLGQPRRRPLGYPRVPSGPEARGLPPLTFPVGQWTCGSPALLCAQLWLQSNDAHLHPCLHLTFFPWLLHHHSRDFSTL